MVRSYITDESGGTVKVIIPAGEPDAGTYLVTWNGHGDALALWRQNADGTLTLANSYTYDTWGKPTTEPHNGVADLGFRFLITRGVNCNSRTADDRPRSRSTPPAR